MPDNARFDCMCLRRSHINAPTTRLASPPLNRLSNRQQDQQLLCAQNIPICRSSTIPSEANTARVMLIQWPLSLFLQSDCHIFSEIAYTWHGCCFYFQRLDQKLIRKEQILARSMIGTLITKTFHNLGGLRTWEQ